MLAEFNSSNPRRCSLSELPYCACANAPVKYHTFPPPPPITFAESYHAYPAYEDGESVVGGADRTFDAEQGQASALAKRMTNVHTIDIALRSSHRTVKCPGKNDGEQACARNCAAVIFRLKPKYNIVHKRYIYAQLYSITTGAPHDAARLHCHGRGRVALASAALAGRCAPAAAGAAPAVRTLFRVPERVHTYSRWRYQVSRRRFWKLPPDDVSVCDAVRRVWLPRKHT